MGRLVLIWVFAFLLLINNLARAEGKTEPVADYKAFLASLPKDDPASITTAIDQYRVAVVPLDMDKHSRAFLEFLDFYDNVCSAVRSAIYRGFDVESHDLPEVLQKSKEASELALHGLELQRDAEGGFYVRGIPDRIPRLFAPYLPRSINRYLELRAVDIRERYCGDGEISVSFARLAERTAQWDQYITAFPHSLLREDARVFRAACLRLLLLGTTNSQLDPNYSDPAYNIRTVYDNFLRDHPDTYAGSLVRRQYDVLKKKGFFNEVPDKDAFTIPCSTSDEVMKWLSESANLCECWLPDDASYRARSCKNQ